ncbi:MAG TPA: hypothetical protein VJ302_27780 [Blastocatellia bacterium]|nr:hypothetical protein [Blastocatellia bacterium]
MKRVLKWTGLGGLLMIGFLVVNAAQKGPNFEGTWTLDQSKSVVPEFMKGQSITWVITQTEKQLARETKLGEGQGDHGGGNRPMVGSLRPTTLNLDGTETSIDTPRGKATSTAKLASGGKALDVSTVLKGSEFSQTTAEHWELSDDGKVLNVSQKRDTPQGVFETKLVFNKK